MFCCFSWEKSTKCSQNPGLVNEFSVAPRGRLNWTSPIASGSDLKLFLKTLQKYHGVGNLYLINRKKLQIGIGIGKFSVINSEELQIGKILGSDPQRGIGIGISKRNQKTK